MQQAIATLVTELTNLQDAISSAIPMESVLSIHHGNWSFPGITGSDLNAAIEDVKTTLQNDIDVDLGARSAYFEAFASRIVFIRAHTVPQLWGNGQAASSAIFMTLHALNGAMASVKKVEPPEPGEEVIKRRREAAKQLRALEAHLGNLTGRSQSADTMMAAIESAHDAAHRLPEDIESLNDARIQIQNLHSEAERDRVHVLAAKEVAEKVSKELADIKIEADKVLEKAEQAYSANTSQGLAAAFSERSKALDISMWGWVFGLIASLLSGTIFGSIQIKALADVLSSPDVQSFTIAINLVLAALSVGGPIWFAWLSTKQVGQRFRLSEDYAFKASISRAYEGYRREAARIDPDLERQLLGSALSRLDEQPLRLVETDSFGSPWHELMSSDVVKNAAKSIPGFVDKVTAMATSAVERKPLVDAVNTPSVVLPEEGTKAKV